MQNQEFLSSLKKMFGPISSPEFRSVHSIRFSKASQRIYIKKKEGVLWLYLPLWNKKIKTVVDSFPKNLYLGEEILWGYFHDIDWRKIPINFFPFNGKIIPLESLILRDEKDFISLIEDPRWWKIKYWEEEKFLVLWDKENAYSEFRYVSYENFGKYSLFRLHCLKDWIKEDSLPSILKDAPRKKRYEFQVLLDRKEEE